MAWVNFIYIIVLLLKFKDFKKQKIRFGNSARAYISWPSYMEVIRHRQQKLSSMNVPEQRANNWCRKNTMIALSVCSFFTTNRCVFAGLLSQPLQKK